MATGVGTRTAQRDADMWDAATKAAEQQAEEENASVLEEPMVSTAQEAFQ